jgi:hypothetical protein
LSGEAISSNIVAFRTVGFSAPDRVGINPANG